MSGQTGQFQIQVAGAGLPAELEPQLASVVVEDNLNLPDLAMIRVRDPHRTAVRIAGVRIGALLRVSAIGPGSAEPVKLIEAEITAVEAEIDSTGSFTVIRGFDVAHRLFRGRHTETYQNVTAADVVRQVAGRAGIPVGTIDATHLVHEHLSQGGVSDWTFLSGLAREIGYELTVRVGKLDFRRPPEAAGAPTAREDTSGAVDPGPLVLQQGSTLLRLRASITSSEQVREVQVRGWDVAAKKPLVGIAPAATASAQLPATDPAKIAEAVGGCSYVGTDIPYRTQAEVDAAAAALAERIGGAFAELEGTARGNPRLRAGSAVAVDSLGEPFDGSYVVTTSRHVWEAATGYVTHFSVTGRQERSLLGLASGGSTAAHGVPGVVVGQVNDVKDPQNLGRVTLAFPWLSDDYVSDWARTVQPGAGQDRGAMVIPEVGDEVMVAFEQGDFRCPYVLGGLYNGVDRPKTHSAAAVDSGSGQVNRRSLVSRRGHRLDLLDARGHQDGIAVTTGDGSLVLTLDAVDTKLLLHSDGTVEVEALQGVTVDAGTGQISLSGGQIQVKASTGLVLDGGTQCTVKGGLVQIN